MDVAALGIASTYKAGSSPFSVTTTALSCKGDWTRKSSLGICFSGPKRGGGKASWGWRLGVGGRPVSAAPVRVSHSGRSRVQVGPEVLLSREADVAALPPTLRGTQLDATGEF